MGGSVKRPVREQVTFKLDRAVAENLLALLTHSLHGEGDKLEFRQ
jgi:hypothetical protein